jgi:hypothetical protein
MNHTHSLFFVFIFFVSGFLLSAQQNVVVERNTLVPLSVQGDFQHLQWELSSDNVSWYLLPGATESTFNYSANAPAFLRARQTAADNSVSYSEVFNVTFVRKSYRKVVKTPGGQGYAETNGQPASGINIREDRGPNGQLNLTAYSDGWTNANASLTWYLYQSAGEYDIDLLLNITNNMKHHFQFSMIDINGTADSVRSLISVNGRGANDTVSVLSVKVAKTGFYKYELKPLNSPANRVRINGLLFNSITAFTPSVHPTNYLSSPSVHLGSWRSTDNAYVAGRKYDWCYMEIIVPSGGEALHTYYMSLGVLQGYMGIQTNSLTERGVIFSMWDDGDTDVDPTLDQYRRAGAVDWDPATTIGRFGNEGTGTKSFVHGWNWDIDVPVKFLTNARLEEYLDTMISVTGADSVVHRRNTLVSAWFHANPEKGWQYISTLRLPNKVTYFDSWYSFIENYGYRNGQVKRHAYYYNGFAREQSSNPSNPGKWLSFNRVNFGNTDGNVGQRRDFEQGQLPENPNYFYMSTGGYANDPIKRATTVPLQDKSVVESLDLDLFLKRVDEAVSKEKIKNDSIKNIERNLADKRGWSIESFSSQEVSGEGPVNGRATTTIDGDKLTFWHSRWTSGGSQFPHHIAVNMNRVEKVTGFLFHLSGGTTRHMKDIELWGATQGGEYVLMKTTAVPDASTVYVALDQPWEISRFKLVIKTSQSGQVHCRINQIDATIIRGTNTGLISAKSGGELRVFQSPLRTNNLHFSIDTNERHLTAVLLDFCGREVFTSFLGEVAAAVTNTLVLPDSIGSGFYILQLRTNTTTRFVSALVL